MKSEPFTVRYPWILLAGILASGAAVWLRLLSVEAPFNKGVFNLLVFLAGMGAAMPLALLFTILGRRFMDGIPFSKLLLLKVNANVDSVVAVRSEDWIGSFIERLTRRSFEVTTGVNGDGSILIAFHKEKGAQVLCFNDSQFSGVATVRSIGDAECRIVSEMKMEDLVVVETGETKALERFHNHLLGFEEDDFKREVPFTLVCGVCVGIAAGVVFQLCRSYPNALGILGSLGWAALSMIAFGMWHIFKKWGEACGLPLGVVSLIVTASFVFAAFR